MTGPKAGLQRGSGTDWGLQRGVRIQSLGGHTYSKTRQRPKEGLGLKCGLGAAGPVYRVDGETRTDVRVKGRFGL